MSDWTPQNKYEVAPGLFVGSEIGDIGREIKSLMTKYLQDGDTETFHKICCLQDKRRELLSSKLSRRITCR